MTTLVLCVDRTNDIAGKTSVQFPVAGWEAVRSLITEIGLADPESSAVNCLLEALRVTRELRDENESTVVAVVSSGGDSLVRTDRSLADQLDTLIDRYSPDSAIIVTDSAQDERVVPVIESRLPVDGVDRVVVRQARDIESTYYLLKQFLADEELRATVLVPLGAGLLLLPVLLIRFTLAVALAMLAALLGAGLLYKGLGIDVLVETIPERTREALYSGQVSVVTYVVAGGLALVGIFIGALAVSEPVAENAVLLPAMEFIHSSVPWLATAGVTASAGRLLDELITGGENRTQYLNLPVGIIAVGVVIRGFSGYFLNQGVTMAGIVLNAGQRLAAFVVLGLLISLVGIRVVMSIGDAVELTAEESR
ncbi:DUF373 family protein [Halalkalirubrum salinum]|uniref:DUF373 family protein n=1 Tax=Halalkalirubrum salinum TaxID=2563889 RepID=UPI0010FACED3|nr:DUF373 family protein [Halalkalirubrum salinum]